MHLRHASAFLATIQCESSPRYIAHLERDPDDWAAVNGQAEVHLRVGEDEAVLALLAGLGRTSSRRGSCRKAAAVFN